MRLRRRRFVMCVVVASCREVGVGKNNAIDQPRRGPAVQGPAVQMTAQRLGCTLQRLPAVVTPAPMTSFLSTIPGLGSDPLIMRQQHRHSPPSTTFPNQLSLITLVVHTQFQHHGWLQGSVPGSTCIHFSPGRIRVYSPATSVRRCATGAARAIVIQQATRR